MILRKKNNNDYFIANREILKNKSISLKSKGLLMLMLSLPDNWDFNINGLKQMNRDGIESLRTAIKELKLYGYLEIKKIDNQGKIDYEWVVSEMSTPYMGKPYTEKPYTENPTLLINNNKLITIKETIKEKFSQNEINDIINYLNEKTGFNYNPKTNNTITLLNARRKEGATIEDCKKVIDNKCNDWLNDSNFCKYLRPQTLFSGKFDTYLQQKPKSKNQPEWYDNYKKNRFKGTEENTQELSQEEQEEIKEFFKQKNTDLTD